MRITSLRAVAVLAAVPLALAACSSGTADAPGGGGGGASGGGGEPVVIGSSLSMTGPLGQFGVALKAGYDQRVSDVNAAGGLDVGGTKRPVQLKVLDNRSDPNMTTQQVRELVLQDSAVAILGSCTPPIAIPAALAAEQQKVPFVTSCTPVNAFRGGNPSGWKSSYTLFFDENEQAKNAMTGLAMAKTNKKVAIFTDNEPDGVAQRPLFKAAALAAGLEVVGDYSFPVGTTDFSSFTSDAKAKGAQLVCATMIPPDGIALWKQMKAGGFAPAQAYVAKASVGASWAQALGDVAEGTLTEAFWSPESGKGNSAQIETSLKKTFPDSFSDLNIAVLGYTVANIVTDGITAAGSTDPAKLNAAIKNTDKDYAPGHIKFDGTNTATTPHLLMQWQRGKVVQILPPVSGVTLEDPAKGLA